MPGSQRWWHAALIIYALALVIGTHTPGVSVGREEYADKVVHFAAFAGLTLLALQAVRVRRTYLVVIVIAVFAAVDESTQPLVGRHASVLDWLADVAGMSVAVAVAPALLRRRQPG